MRITEITAADVLADCPELEPFASTRDGEVFICANGFEDRARAVASLLAHDGARYERAILLTYPSSAWDNDSQRADLEAQLRQISDNVVSVDGESHDATFEAAIAHQMSEATTAGESIQVLFDISGCSGRFILRVLRVLFDLANSGADVHLRIAYTQALRYAPTQAEATEILSARARDPLETRPASLGLDWDAGEVAHLIERPGQHIDHAPDRAIVICGFNADRIRASLDRIDTDFNVDFPHPRVTYIAGLPPKPEDRWRLQAMVEINSSDEGIAPEPLTASTLDYRDTLKLLESIYDEHGGHNKLTVLPFGSKMQSLAVALFCEAHADVRVQMLAPSRYRSVEYSMGVEAAHQLELGALSELSQQLRRIGELEVASDAGAVPERAFTYDEGDR